MPLQTTTQSSFVGNKKKGQLAALKRSQGVPAIGVGQLKNMGPTPGQ